MMREGEDRGRGEKAQVTDLRQVSHLQADLSQVNPSADA
jgi:hypothetical protein